MPSKPCIAFAAFAALAAAAPSPAALRPYKAVCDLNESDITGSGREVPSDGPSRQASLRGQGKDSETVRHWRSLAAQCRNLAQWLNPSDRGVLLKLADEYEARAAQAEKSEG